MSEPTEETIETVKVKFVRNVKYKGAEFKAGSTATVETVIADRLIEQGNVELATDEEKGKKTK
ncbi:MAG: hypothetical protein IPL32_19950 [Chloracidobacterium sp.]|nr:hypothetical protein [Chloracidobacterium sp.]